MEPSGARETDASSAGIVHGNIQSIANPTSDTVNERSARSTQWQSATLLPSPQASSVLLLSPPGEPRRAAPPSEWKSPSAAGSAPSHVSSGARLVAERSVAEHPSFSRVSTSSGTSVIDGSSPSVPIHSREPAPPSGGSCASRIAHSGDSFTSAASPSKPLGDLQAATAL